MMIENEIIIDWVINSLMLNNTNYLFNGIVVINYLLLMDIIYIHIISMEFIGVYFKLSSNFQLKLVTLFVVVVLL